MLLSAPQGQFCHLILNGSYWGFCNLQERPAAEHFKEMLVCNQEDWDVLRAGGPIISGQERVDLAGGEHFSSWAIKTFIQN